MFTLCRATTFIRYTVDDLRLPSAALEEALIVDLKEYCGLSSDHEVPASPRTLKVRFGVPPGHEHTCCRVRFLSIFDVTSLFDGSSLVFRSFEAKNPTNPRIKSHPRHSPSHCSISARSEKG